MIATVTTTVSTIVSSSAAVGLLGSVGLAALLVLITSLVMKELASGTGVRLKLFGQNLDTIVLPLLFVFSFIVSAKIWDVLS